MPMVRPGFAPLSPVQRGGLPGVVNRLQVAQQQVALDKQRQDQRLQFQQLMIANRQRLLDQQRAMVVPAPMVPATAATMIVTPPPMPATQAATSVQPGSPANDLTPTQDAHDPAGAADAPVAEPKSHTKLFLIGAAVLVAGIGTVVIVKRRGKHKRKPHAE
jgi:hypothetical protein